MAKDFSRTRRIGEQIQRELAQLVQYEIKDPRLGMVTVSAVEVSRDLAHAKVFIMMSGSKEEIKTSLDILNKAAGFLRHQLSQSMLLRSVPHLKFIHDESMERGDNLAALIEHAVATDKAKSTDNKD